MKKDFKVVKHCFKCDRQLKKYNKHHYLCEGCWEEDQLKKGNLSLLGGVR